MPITFNSILLSEGIAPADVRLIRHKDSSANKGRSIYQLWRDDRPAFDLYQSLQDTDKRSRLCAKYWAVFVVNGNNANMFAGLFEVANVAPLSEKTAMPHSGEFVELGSCDLYELVESQHLKDLIGRLFINWGAGALAWVQYADRNEKIVTELKLEFQEDVFPGYLNFIDSISGLAKLPASWISALQSSRGIYLLTCPRTKEQYVGSATGEAGFWGRWKNYMQDSHGGNLGLKSRDPSDYQISILETAGTSSTPLDILKMEGRWQRKLQSLEMGLNRNLAGN